MAVMYVSGLLLALVCVGMTNGQIFATKDELSSFGNVGTEVCPFITTVDNKYRFFVFLNATHAVVYPTQECAAGTEWSASKCDCIKPPNQLIPGVDARTLLGSPAPNTVQATCGVLANISYSQATGKFGSATYVQMGDDPAKAKLDEVRVQGPAGSSGPFVVPLSGSSPLVMESFRGNQLVGPWESTLRFQPSRDFRGSAVLLSDECKDPSKSQEEAKSLEVVFTGTSVNVYLRLKNKTINRTCSVKADSNGWYELQMASDFTDIKVSVSGSNCVTEDAGEALWLKCALNLGGRLQANTQGMLYLDYFKFIKNPRKCVV